MTNAKELKDADVLSRLYRDMSIDNMAIHLGVTKAKLYYHMRKLGVVMRSKSDAQKLSILLNGHQRCGKKHSRGSRNQISINSGNFWDSDKGIKQKKMLSKLRKEKWNNATEEEQQEIVMRLQNAERPKPGQLSKFGIKFANFLQENNERINVCVRLVSDHASDIVLVEHKVVLELILPISIYGEEQANILAERYLRLQKSLNDIGYRVVVIEDVSNTLSQARCNRIYSQLKEFFKTDLQRLTIRS